MIDLDNGHLDTFVPKKSRKSKPVKSAAENGAAKTPNRTFRRLWARIASVPVAGVCLTSVLSAALNGYCYSQHSPSPIGGWVLGVSIPAIILILGKVAGTSFKKSRWWVGAAAAISGIALLALSVVHCAESIALITGSGMAMSIPLAIAIDCGLVSCEMAIIADEIK